MSFVCPGEVALGEGQVEERRWTHRRRQPEGTVLDEAVRDLLAMLLADVFACAGCEGRLGLDGLRRGPRAW